MARLPWPSSIRLRLTLWFTLILGAPLVAFAVGAYVFLERTLLTRTDRFVTDALTAFTREVEAERRRAPNAAAAAMMTLGEVRFRDLRVVVADDAGKLLAVGEAADAGSVGAAPPLALDANALVRAAAGDEETQSFVLDGPDGGHRVVARTVNVAGEVLHVAGAYPMRDIREVLDRVGGAILVTVPLLLAGAALGGYFLAKRSLSPVSAMGARAAEISASNLSARLPIADPKDELGGLATVVNALLDRLEGAFAQQRRFMADASHELRTPTAILRTEADVTLSRDHRTESEYRESVVVMQDAAHRLTRIVDDLFLLARADAGHMVPRREPLYLEEVVHDATRAVRHLADSRGIRVELADVVEAPIEGDADLLGRLVLNLLDNASKYSMPGGRVTVSLTQRATSQGTWNDVSVVDDGVGIPPELHERIFERFYRVDAARSRTERTATSGAGLGLAIARRIAEAHGGTLTLISSRPGRSEFRLSLPAAPFAASPDRDAP